MSPTPANAEHLWHSFDNFLFDADGVLWADNIALEGAVELLDALLKAGKRVLIVTNNATKGTEEYVQKCQRLGFKGLSPSNIVGSGVVLAHYLSKLKSHPDHAASAHLPVYLVGSKALQKLLKQAGIESFGPGPDPVPPEQDLFPTADQVVSINQLRAFAVVGSFDVHLSYLKVMKAVNILSDPAVPFLVTNEDAVFPGPYVPSLLLPGAGTVTSTLRHVSGREPIIMGKPSSICWDYICEKFPGQIEPARTLMIGDRCDTDIQFGRSCGLSTLLVLTGIHSLKDVDRFAGQGKHYLVPEFYAPTLRNLLPTWKMN